MAKVERGTFTVISTGNKIYSLVDTTLTPDRMLFSVTTNSGNERTLGFWSSGLNFCGSSGTYTDSSTTKAISHHRNISSTKTKTLEGTGTGSGAGEFYMNFTTVTENTQVSFVAEED